MDAELGLEARGQLFGGEIRHLGRALKWRPSTRFLTPPTHGARSPSLRCLSSVEAALREKAAC